MLKCFFVVTIYCTNYDIYNRVMIERKQTLYFVSTSATAEIKIEV